MRYPLDKIQVTQGFGENPDYYAKYGMSGHNGLDLRTRYWNTPLGRRYCYACEDGVITELTYNNTGYGNYLKIKGKDGWFLYGHLKSFKVINGQQVKEGDLIGITDSTGDVDGPHLHFGWRPNGFNINNGFRGYEDPNKLFKPLPDLKNWEVAFIGNNLPNMDEFVARVGGYTNGRLKVVSRVISAQIKAPQMGIPDYSLCKTFLDTIDLGTCKSAFIFYPANSTSTFEVATYYPEKNLGFATVPMPATGTILVHAFLHLIRKYINFNHLGFIEDVEKYPTNWSNAGDYNDPGWGFAEQYAQVLPFLK